MSHLMKFLLEIWFRGYLYGYMAGREQEVESYNNHIRKQCDDSPSGCVVIRNNGKDIDMAQLPKGVIAGWRNR